MRTGGDGRLATKKNEIKKLNHSLHLCHSWQILKHTRGFLFFCRTLTPCIHRIC